MIAVQPSEAYRLTKLAEECAEVIKVCTKILTFGFESVGPQETDTNRALLAQELGDVVARAKQLADFGCIDEDAVIDAAEAKTAYIVEHGQDKL